jgi:hypothetical protein
MLTENLREFTDQITHCLQIAFGTLEDLPSVSAVCNFHCLGAGGRAFKSPRPDQ